MIGKKGRTAKAMRTLLQAVAGKSGQAVHLEIMDPVEPAAPHLTTPMTAPKESETPSGFAWGKSPNPLGFEAASASIYTTPTLKPYNQGLRIELRPKGSLQRQKVVVQSNHGGGRVVFENFTNRNAVEELRNHEVWIERAHLPPVSDEEAYLRLSPSSSI